MSARGLRSYAETILPLWFDFALCAETDPDLFFAEDEEGEAGTVAKARGMTDAALRVCARCPVRDLCLDYAMEHNLIWGVWGGTTYNDRLEMRNQRRQGQPERCRNGHIRTAANTRTDASGTRHCLECAAAAGEKRVA